MKTTKLGVLCCTVLAAALAPACSNVDGSHRNRGDEHGRLLEFAPGTRPLASLIAVAEAAAHGAARSAELEVEDGKSIATIMVFGADGLVEVEIDAVTGAVLEVEKSGAEDDDDDADDDDHDDDEDVEDEDETELARPLEEGTRTLAALILIAESAAHGTCRSAAFETEKGRTIAEMLVLGTDGLVVVELDGVTGEVIEIEKASSDDHDDDDDDDDDDDR